MKRCNRCMAYKRRHPYYFYRSTRLKSGFSTPCKECTREKARDWSRTHHAEALARAEQWRQNNYQRYRNYNKKYAQAHPEHDRRKRSRREAMIRGASIVEHIDHDIIYMRDKGI